MPSSNNLKYMSLTGMETYTDEVKKLIHQMIIDSSEFEIITANSYLNFPITGNEAKLYIDSGANKTYRWNESDFKYYCIGSDYNDISQINGTF